jgi:hypothetical protein
LTYIGYAFEESFYRAKIRIFSLLSFILKERSKEFSVVTFGIAPKVTKNAKNVPHTQLLLIVSLREPNVRQTIACLGTFCLSGFARLGFLVCF